MTAPGGSPAGRARGHHPGAMLEPELLERIRVAVDEHEVAVLLESAGISDRVAADEYDVLDVFDLAVRLRTSTGAPPRLPSPGRPDWYVSSPVAVLRGCLFTVAGLVSVGLAGSGVGRNAAIWVLVWSAVWVAMLQGLSFLGYLLRERGGPGSQASSIAPLIPSFAVPVLAGMATAVFAGPGSGVVTGAALLVLTGVVLLLVVDRPWAVASVVLPVGAVAAWAISGGPINSQVAIALWAGSGVVLAITTVAVTGGVRLTGPVPLSRQDVRSAGPFVVAGLGIGAMSVAVVVVVAPAPTLSGASDGVWLVAAAPFLVPVSIAELLVVTVRRSLLAATTRTRGLDEFRHLARRQAVRMWTAHLALMATLALACTWLLPLVSPAEPTWTEALSLVAAFGLLGTVLTAGLLLLAAGRLARVSGLLWGGAALVFLVRLVAGGWSPAVVVVLAFVSAAGVVVSSLATEGLDSYR
ncbi:MAG: hypothetical protein EKK62_15300 [Acidimicrobiia bacterium]|nr:MAG: hypothetical protein EKK62_15300 [Acidimicrobiia bacterium]